MLVGVREKERESEKSRNGGNGAISRPIARSWSRIGAYRVLRSRNPSTSVGSPISNEDNRSTITRHLLLYPPSSPQPPARPRIPQHRAFFRVSINAFD